MEDIRIWPGRQARLNATCTSPSRNPKIGYRRATLLARLNATCTSPSRNPKIGYRRATLLARLNATCTSPTRNPKIGYMRATLLAGVSATSPTMNLCVVTEDMGYLSEGGFPYHKSNFSFKTKEKCHLNNEKYALDPNRFSPPLQDNDNILFFCFTYKNRSSNPLKQMPFQIKTQPPPGKTHSLFKLTYNGPLMLKVILPLEDISTSVKKLQTPKSQCVLQDLLCVLVYINKASLWRKKKR